jgi:hypothetical protein
METNCKSTQEEFSTPPNGIYVSINIQDESRAARAREEEKEKKEHREKIFAQEKVKKMSFFISAAVSRRFFSFFLSFSFACPHPQLHLMRLLGTSPLRVETRRVS